MSRDDWRDFGKDGWGEDPNAGQGCALAVLIGAAFWFVVLTLWWVLSR
jgi:hypothetical protein